MWGDFIENVQKDDEEKTTKTDIAKQFLQDILANGALPQVEISTAALEKGISKRTLDRAKSELNIKSYLTDKKWFWQLPEK